MSEGQEGIFLVFSQKDCPSEAYSQMQLGRAARSHRRDVLHRTDRGCVIRERLRQRQVFLRRGRAKNGLGQLSIAFVPPRGDLRMQAAAAGIWMAQRGHAPCISKSGSSQKERGVLPAAAEGPLCTSLGTTRSRVVDNSEVASAKSHHRATEDDDHVAN